MVPLSGGNPYASTSGSDGWSSDFTQATEYKDPKKAKADAESELKGIKRKERKKQRKADEAESAATSLIVIGVLAAIAWIVPCLGSRWHTRTFNAMGVYTEMYTGLFSINFEAHCHQMKWGFGLDDVDAMKNLDPQYAACRVLSTMNGKHNMGAFKDLACSIPGNSCEIMSTIWLSSFLMLFACCVSAIMSLIAALFIYYYWFVEHLKVIRNFALGLFCLAPCMATMAFIMYSLVSPDIGDLPRAWNAWMQTIPFTAGTGLLSVKAIGEDVPWNTHGWCWFFLFISFGFAVAGPVVWGTFFKKHPDEDAHILAAEEEKQAMEEAIENVYQQEGNVRELAAVHATAQAPGGTPAYPAVTPAYGASPTGAYGQTATGYPGAYQASPTGAYGQTATGYTGYPGYNQNYNQNQYAGGHFATSAQPYSGY